MAVARVLIADDEPLARSHIERLLGLETDFEIVGQFGSAHALQIGIVDSKPDLVILDIEMADIHFLDTRAFSYAPVFILTTSQDACIAFLGGAQAIDCILKPFDAERFAKSLERARAYLGLDGSTALRSQHLRLLTALPDESLANGTSRSKRAYRRYFDRVLVRDGDRIYFVKVEDIDRIESIHGVARVHTSNRSHLLGQDLDELSRHLDPRQFLRIRGSTVINLERLGSDGFEDSELIRTS